MRQPQQSPFSPGSDTIPDIWAGRVSELSDWRDVVRPRRLAGTPERGRTILGEPGMGKSSLVRRIARHAEQEGDWVTPQLRIALGVDPITMLAKGLLRLASRAGLANAREKRIADLIGRVESVSVGPASLGLHPAEGSLPHEALKDLLIEIGRAARKRGNTMVLIHLDEIQNIDDDAALSQLLIALGDALVYEEECEAPGGVFFSEALPIAVYLTGLPEFEERAGASRGATFVRRFRTMTLKPLAADDLRLALDVFTRSGWKMAAQDGTVSSIRMEREAREMIVDMSAGDPFLFQLAGERAWYAGSGDVVTADDAARGWETAKGEAEDHVARILERLPPKEREFIEIMAELDPSERSMTRIARQAGYAKATTVGPLARRLDEKRGLIVRGKPVYKFRHRAVEAYLTTDWPEPPEGETSS